MVVSVTYTRMRRLGDQARTLPGTRFRGRLRSHIFAQVRLAQDLVPNTHRPSCRSQKAGPRVVTAEMMTELLVVARRQQDWGLRIP